MAGPVDLNLGKRDGPTLALCALGLARLPAPDLHRRRADDELLVLAPREQGANGGQVAVVRRRRRVPIPLPQVGLELSPGDLSDVGVTAELVDEAFA